MINRPSPKTPYEIRLELLQLAQVILHQQHQAAGVTQNGTVRALTAPTTEEVIDKADKLNQFVSKGNSQ